MAVNPQWKAWVDDRHPGNKFTDGEIARVYLHEAKKVKVQGRQSPSEPVIIKKCPGCGGDMIYFPLCASCKLAMTTGARGMWVCPDSVGIKQKVNEMDMGAPGDRTYADLIVAYKHMAAPQDPTCQQIGILDMGVS